MKKLIIPLFLVLFCVELYSQNPVEPILSKDYYLQKSKNQNTAAWTLLIGGTAMAVGGIIGFSQNFEILGGNDTQARRADTYGFILLGGLVGDLVSIPLFFSAAKNRKKAATLSLVNNQILFRQPGPITQTLVPALCLKIRF